MKTDEQKLNIVGAAAQLLLENGSETYRVEETAQTMFMKKKGIRICRQQAIF